MSISTKEALAEALIELLRERTLDQITVKDITDRCRVNRQTFYYHFEDVYALLKWIFTQRLEKTSIEMFSLDEWFDAFIFFFNDLIGERDLLINAYRSLDRDQLKTYLMKISYKLVENYANTHYSTIPIKKSNFEFVISFYSLMIVNIVIDWFEKGMPESYEQVLNQFYTLVNGSMEFSFKQFLK